MYRDNARGRGVIFDLTYGSHRDQRFPSDALATDDVIVVTRVKKVKKMATARCTPASPGSWMVP